jgi:K+-transporting ATPase KdpF subunit
MPVRISKNIKHSWQNSLQIPYTASTGSYKIIINSAATLYCENEINMNAIIFISKGLCKIDTSSGYLIGILVSLFIFCYLIYSLLKPDKF